MRTFPSVEMASIFSTSGFIYLGDYMDLGIYLCNAAGPDKRHVGHSNTWPCRPSALHPSPVEKWLSVLVTGEPRMVAIRMRSSMNKQRKKPTHL